MFKYSEYIVVFKVIKWQKKMKTNLAAPILVAAK
jgi:hypothetical protein